MSPSTVALPHTMHSLGPIATEEVLRDTMKGALYVYCTCIDISGEGRRFLLFVHQVLVYVSSAHRFHYCCGENNRTVKLNVQEGAVDEAPVELDESV